jgi:hypothetical protein
MIERRDQRPPVTYTTFQARDLGGDTAELVKRSIRDAVDRFQPQALLVGESCTAELIQDQPGALAQGMGLEMPVVNLELPAYSKRKLGGSGNLLSTDPHPAQTATATLWTHQTKSKALARAGQAAPSESVGTKPAGISLP